MYVYVYEFVALRGLCVVLIRVPFRPAYVPDVFGSLSGCQGEVGNACMHNRMQVYGNAKTPTTAMHCRDAAHQPRTKLRQLTHRSCRRIVSKHSTPG